MTDTSYTTMGTSTGATNYDNDFNCAFDDGGNHYFSRSKYRPDPIIEKKQPMFRAKDSGAPSDGWEERVSIDAARTPSPPVMREAMGRDRPWTGKNFRRAQ